MLHLHNAKSERVIQEECFEFTIEFVNVLIQRWVFKEYLPTFPDS